MSTITNKNQFVEDWNDRYKNKMCTLDHLNRLLAINRLTKEEYEYIIQCNKERDI